MGPIIRLILAIEDNNIIHILNVPSGENLSHPRPLQLVSAVGIRLFKGPMGLNFN